MSNKHNSPKTRISQWWERLSRSTRIILSEKKGKASYDGLSEDEIEEIYNSQYLKK